MNKKDIKILKMLQSNARLPYSKIAKKLGITENAVKYRVKQLEKKGIIKGYFLDISSFVVGKKVRVIFMLNVKPGELEDSIVKLSSYKEIAQVFRCAGQFSIICTGFFQDNPELVKFLDTKLLKELPITNWVEHVILKPYKETFFCIDMVE